MEVNKKNKDLEGLRTLTYASDLIANDVRTRIQSFDKNGKETYITVFNIKGERRAELMDEFQDMFENIDNITEEVFNEFYSMLVLEFTDLVLDTQDIIVLLTEGNFVAQKLIQEFNDMIFEIQINYAFEQLALIRQLAVARISQASIQLMEDTERRVKEITKIGEVKQPKKSQPRRKKPMKQAKRRR